LAKDVKAVAIPSTIQDMIMARVDSLPDATRTVLQTGSVIEREFPYELIKRVTGLPEQPLLTHLSVLKDSELLYERGIYPQTSYIFRHALTREVVYDSILARKKKELHEEIGKGIEEIYKEVLENYYATLARHFMLGENYQKGAEYFAREARRIELSTYSLFDTMIQTKQRVFCIEKMAQTVELQKQRIDARLDLAWYLNRINHHYESQEVILPILDLIMKQGTKEQICRLRMFQGTYHYFIEEDLSAAMQCYQEALTIAEDVKDLNTLYLCSNWFGVALGFNCQFEESIPYLKRAVEITVSIQIYSSAVYKSNLAFFGYFLPGRINLALRISAEAVRMAEETGSTYPVGIACTWYGLFLNGRGLFKEAEGYLIKANELCSRNNNVIYHGWANACLGENYIQMADFLQAKNHYRKAIEIFEQNRLWPSSWLALAKAGLARAKVMNKEKDIDLESLLPLSRNVKVKAAEGWISRYIGEILLNIDDLHMPEAEEYIQKAIDSDQRNGMKFHLGTDYALYADLFKRKGDRLKTQENLGKAIEILKECGADGWVEKYEKELAAIS
jgi:tetratricopeptide (TPR) repeat protein